MAKKNRTIPPETVLAWTKLSFNLPIDERIRALIEKEGSRGFGAYMLVVLEMLKHKKQRMTMNQLKHLSIPGYKHPEKLTEYKELFEVADDGFVYPLVGLMPEVATAADVFRFDSRSASTSDNVTDVAPTNDANDDAEPLCVRAYRGEQSKAEENTVKDDCHHPKDGDDVSSTNEDFISQIPLHSEWTETALMKSGFGALIQRNWDFALKQFRSHALVNCNLGNIHSVDDAKKYFHFYITNQTSGIMLKKVLEEHERNMPVASPYRFEDDGSCQGHRCYHGIPLPDEAPPRPDDRAEWDYEQNCWISL